MTTVDGAPPADLGAAVDAAPPMPPVPPILGWDDCGAVPMPLESPGVKPVAFGIAVSPAARWLVATTSRSAPVWRVADDFPRSTIARMLESPLPIYAEFSSDGALVAISGDGRGLFASETGRPVFVPDPPSGVAVDCWMAFFSFSRRGRWVAGTGYRNHVDVFAVDTQDPVASLPSSSCNSAAAFSADDTLVATAVPELYRTSDWSRLWPASVTPAHPPSVGPEVLVESVSFTPNGKYLLTSKCALMSAHQVPTCENRFFSVETGAPLGGVLPFKGARPSFAPDGRWLVAGGDVYNLATEEVRHLGDFSVATFASSGDIFAADTDGNLRRLCARR